MLGDGHQAPQGLDTDVMLPLTRLNALEMAAPQGSHVNPPSNRASVPVQALRISTPPNFSIKVVCTAPQGSLPLVGTLLGPLHWSWVLPSALYKLIKKISLVFYFSSAELGRYP